MNFYASIINLAKKMHLYSSKLVRYKMLLAYRIEQN